VTHEARVPTRIGPRVRAAIQARRLYGIGYMLYVFLFLVAGPLLRYLHVHGSPVLAWAVLGFIEMGILAAAAILATYAARSSLIAKILYPLCALLQPIGIIPLTALFVGNSSALIKAGLHSRIYRWLLHRREGRAVSNA
jgi:hypothetical protein